MSTCVVTGTIFTTKTRESDIVAGGATIILTLTGTTWVVAAGSAFDNQRQNIINGLTSAQSEATGWNAEVKAKIAVGEVVRTGNTIVTITLAAQAAYDITACDVITVTVPSTAVDDAAAIVCTPVFTVVPQPWTYYVSPDGLDTNNGLSPDATTANVNKPLKTVGKTMNTGAPIRPGDTIYIAPGVTNETATVTPVATICSSAVPTSWLGDPNNVQGFKDSNGVRREPGVPRVTTRTAAEGDDGTHTTLVSTNLFTLSTNKPSGMTFRFLHLETGYGSGGAGTFSMELTTVKDILVEDCVLTGFFIVFANGAPTELRNWTFRRCIVFAPYSMFRISVTTAAASANADLTILVEECFVVGQLCGGTAMALGSDGGNLGGGLRFYDNTVITADSHGIVTTALRVSTTTPVRFGGCLFITGVNVAVNAGTSGQVVDDGYNRIMGAASTNCALHATSFLRPAWQLVMPHLHTWGLEMPRSDFLGWMDSAHANQKYSASGRTTSDFRGRTPRPWGAGSSIGCWQAQSVAKDTSSAVTGGGANSLKLTGAGEVSVYIPVDATAFTVSVTTVSTDYGGASYPQMIVMADPSLGVTSNTTVTAAADTIEKITTATITPTSKGIMEVRLISRSSDVTSLTYFDLLVTPAVSTVDMDYWKANRLLPALVSVPSGGSKSVLPAGLGAMG